MRSGEVARALLGTIVGLTASCVLEGSSRAQNGTESEPEALATAYDAPAGCPDRAAFFEGITARTRRARAARAGESARVLRVAVASDGGAFRGRLVIEDGANQSSPRDVDGATCAEVVEALGLVAALAVDPKASTAPRSELAARSSEGPPAAPPSTAPPREAPRTRPVAEPDSGSRLAAGVQVEGAALAGAVFGGRIFGELTFGDRTGVVVPSLRFALGRSLDVDREPTVGRASLRWTQAGLDACPLRFALVETLALRPCAGVSFGVLEAQGTGVNDARDRARPWGAASVYGRLVWQPIALLSFEVEGGPVMPFFRETFFFESGTAAGVAIYEPPVIAFLGRGGVALHFP